MTSMSQQLACWLGLVVLVTAGCASGATMRTIEMQRVDQDLTQGNRGYLVGTPPPPPVRRTTREILELEVPIGTADDGAAEAAQFGRPSDTTAVAPQTTTSVPASEGRWRK